VSEKKALVEKVIKSLPKEFVDRGWCGGPDAPENFACACLGCVNSAFIESGLDYEDFIEYCK